MPPEFLGPITSEVERSLAFRNIRRGQLRGLPAAHDVAREMVAREMGLTADQVVPPDVIWQQVKQRLERSGSNYNPSGKPVPMWLYILFEAQAKELGQTERLGPMATAIISAVFLGLLERDPKSILSEHNWQPTLGPRVGQFGIADLIGMAEAQKTRLANHG